MTYNIMRDFGNVCDQIKNPFRTKFGVLSFGEIIQTKIFFQLSPLLINILKNHLF